jgi:hypothetical protein
MRSPRWLDHVLAVFAIGLVAILVLATAGHASTDEDQTVWFLILSATKNHDAVDAMTTVAGFNTSSDCAMAALSTERAARDAIPGVDFKAFCTAVQRSNDK